MMRSESVQQDLARFRPIAVLLAAASALSGSPSMIDRMANALSPEPAIRTLRDSLRLVDSELSRSESERRLKFGIGTAATGREYRVIEVKDETGVFQIIGHLPSSEMVREFIDRVQNDTALARKIGAYASAILVESRSRAPLAQENEVR
ncbi:MAG: hypothetical protein ABDH63_03685 [Candidatus Caldarchaeales archaeon]